MVAGDWCVGFGCGSLVVAWVVVPLVAVVGSLVPVSCSWEAGLIVMALIPSFVSSLTPYLLLEHWHDDGGGGGGGNMTSVVVNVVVVVVMAVRLAVVM